MSLKLRVYLDTSVLSAILDPREPSRQHLTQAFWTRRGSFDAVISALVIDEIERTKDRDRAVEMRTLASMLPILPQHPEADTLAREYINRSVFTHAMIDDAMHVARAVTAGITVLASWNFKHLVNRSRRVRVNLVNTESGWGQIDIVTPAEL